MALVVLYHFAPELVPGGFLGVDVFFVLSGFLLTSLALGEHQSTGTIAAGAFFAKLFTRQSSRGMSLAQVHRRLSARCSPAHCLLANVPHLNRQSGRGCGLPAARERQVSARRSRCSEGPYGMTTSRLRRQAPEGHDARA